MPANLSFRHRASTGGFYTRIHKSMIVPAADTLPPSTKEFQSWLKGAFPSPDLATALDAGCGVHAFNARSCLANGFSAVSAVDINQDAVEAGADIGVRLGSVLDLPFAADGFDLTVCGGVAHHTPDPDRAFAELFRVTRPGGTAYISLYCFRRSLFHVLIRLWRLAGRVVPYRLAHALFGRIQAINNFVLDHTYVPILWLYSAEEARAALERAGWIVETDFASCIDPFERRPLGRWIVGGGLLRVFVCRKPA